jgi:endonuclease III
LNSPGLRLKTKTQAFRILEIIQKSIHTTTALGSIRDKADSDPFRILISTILSARTRDPVTEAASRRLFFRFPDVRSLARGKPQYVMKTIKPVSFYRVKAHNIIKCSKQILKEFNGKVPQTYEELVQLAGVGRKTAGCVLVYGYSEPAIPVDVHVHRISNRIGLVRTQAPEETETALRGLYDRKYWIDVNELFVSFGQSTCRPLNPKCQICPVRKLCNYYKTAYSKRGA